MRHLLLFFIHISIATSYGQEIEIRGRYEASFIGGERIEFIGKDSFYFSGFYCTYGVHGKGRCEIRNNYLYLYFEKNKTRAKIDSLKPAKISKTAMFDSVTQIQITVVDNNDIPIPYVSVEIESAKSGKIITLTDTLGQVSIQIKNNSSPLVIKTAAIGIEPGHLKLDKGSGYTIKLFHRPSELADKALNNGEVYVYEIAEMSEELILMRPQNSSERFRKYIKKKD